MDSKQAPIRKAAIYARSVTRSQEVTGMSSINQQIAEGRKYGTEQGYILDEKHIYQEIIGGKRNGNHPIFPLLDALRAAAKKHEFDVLIITSIDNLARDILFRSMILEELTQAGITVESIDGYSLDDAAWKQLQELKQAVLEKVAQIERQQIIKRTQYGRAAKKAQRDHQQ
jgi:DNA invertase Pin-like site-specific DNA recombinase